MVLTAQNVFLQYAQIVRFFDKNMGSREGALLTGHN